MELFRVGTLVGAGRGVANDPFDGGTKRRRVLHDVTHEEGGEAGKAIEVGRLSEVEQHLDAAKFSEERGLKLR